MSIYLIRIIDKNRIMLYPNYRCCLFYNYTIIIQHQNKSKRTDGVCMKTKIISTVLTATLIFSSLIISGCNKSTDKQQSSNNSVAESSVNSTESVSEKSPDEKSSDKQSDNENSVVSDDVSEQNSEPVESKVTPTVWEVTDSNNNSLYMMGTIHLADKDALVLPDYFEAAYAKCDALAAECDITSTDIDISSFSKYAATRFF